MRPMSKGAVEAILRAISFGVGLMDADSSFVVAQVISPLCVTSSSMQEWTPEAQGKRQPNFGHVLVAGVDCYERTC